MLHDARRGEHRLLLTEYWYDHLTTNETVPNLAGMPLQPVTRRSVPDEVFDQVLGEVVAGRFGAGEALPSERRLAEVLGVSRPAVREALQRMAQTRLVEVRHGGATTVRDFQRYAGLDLLPTLLVRDGSVDLSVARSVVEARLLIGPGVAALAAERRTPGLVDRLGEVVDAYAACEEPVERQRLTLTYWDLVVDAADSVTFRLLFNSLRAAYEPALTLLAPVLGTVAGSGSSRAGAYRVLTAAIGEGDPDTTRAAAERVLRSSTDALLTALDAVEDR
jgi:GntR family transcriptional regulator, transcriptional repressor for pyruvate dehydrogenase complex